MLKLYPSMYQRLHGVTTDPAFRDGCLRYIMLKSLGVLPRDGDIDPLYKAVGRLAEERFLAVTPELYSREVPCSWDLGDDVILSGRADFVNGSRVAEIKGTLSSTKRTGWRKGLPAEEHLGQLLTYMQIFMVQEGELNCSYLHFDKAGEHLRFENFVFRVAIDEDQNVRVNGEIIAPARELLAFWGAAKQALIGADLPPRPMSTNPCSNCPLQAVCDSAPQDRTTFIREVEQLVANGLPAVAQPVPKIKVHNTRSGTHDER